jgi:hypothetical protein
MGVCGCLSGALVGTVRIDKEESLDGMLDYERDMITLNEEHVLMDGHADK